MSNTALRPLSVEEFLDWERRQDRRHEFVDGIIRAMVGASLGHNVLIGNLARALHPQARSRGCTVFTEGAKLRIGARIYYPDVAMTCSAFRSDDEAVPNPVLIAEVLSKSTEPIDRIEKLLAYRTLPSLLYYLIVPQDAPQVELHIRDGEGWRQTVVEPPAVIALDALGARIDLAELYADTSVVPGETPQA